MWDPGREVRREVGRNRAMQKIALDAKASEVSAELVRRGIAAEARVRALVEAVG
jgi:hypothetical protein